MTVLLEYINLFSDWKFYNQGFIAWPNNSSIMLNAFRPLLCLKLCQRNGQVPTLWSHINLYEKPYYCIQNLSLG